MAPPLTTWRTKARRATPLGKAVPRWFNRFDGGRLDADAEVADLALGRRETRTAWRGARVRRGRSRGQGPAPRRVPPDQGGVGAGGRRRASAAGRVPELRARVIRRSGCRQ